MNACPPTETVEVTVTAMCHCLSGGDPMTCDLHGLAHPACTCGATHDF